VENFPHSPLTTLAALEDTIRKRDTESYLKEDSELSWTKRLLSDNQLLCKKVREEANELCETLELNEGTQRTASEAADVLYHMLVLLYRSGVSITEAIAVLRGRFGISGIAEKASRVSKD